MLQRNTIRGRSRFRDWEQRMGLSRSAGVSTRRIANRIQQFQRPKISRPNLSSPLRTTRILIPPESTGRASGRRSNGFRGWSSGKRSPVVFSDASGVHGRFPETWGEALAAEDRRTRQAWAEIAHAVRRVASLPPVGGRLRERVKTPRPDGSPENGPRGAPELRRNGIQIKATPGEARALRTLPIPSQLRRVSAKPRLLMRTGRWACPRPWLTHLWTMTAGMGTTCA